MEHSMSIFDTIKTVICKLTKEQVTRDHTVIVCIAC